MNISNYLINIHSILDEQSHQFYIKDISGWECDKKEEKLDDTIENVSKKQEYALKKQQNVCKTVPPIDTVAVKAAGNGK